MKITDKARMHLDTAELLMQGMKESIKYNDKEPGTPPPEHSAESIKRRCVQIRQELLMVEQGISAY